MGVNKKSLDEIGNEYGYLWNAVTVLVPLLRPLYGFEFIRRRFRNSVGGRVGEISRYAQRGLYEQAAERAIEAVKYYRNQPAGRFQPSGYDYLWFFMQMATESLSHCDDQTGWDELLEIARGLEEPKEDFQGASAFLNFSRWKYRTGDYEAAIGFAEIASGADSSWGEPDFMLGWYDLALGGGNPLDHFTNAIRKDDSMLFRIMNDPVCKRYPHIVEPLKALAKNRVVVAE